MPNDHLTRTVPSRRSELGSVGKAQPSKHFTHHRYICHRQTVDFLFIQTLVYSIISSSYEYNKGVASTVQFRSNLPSGGSYLDCGIQIAK